MSLIRFGTIQKSNSRQMVHKNFTFLFFYFLFVYSFPLFFLLLHQFLGISGNSDQHIIFLAPKQLWKLLCFWYFKQTFGQFIKEADLLLITFYLLYFLFFSRNLFVFLKYFQEPNSLKGNFFKTLKENFQNFVFNHLVVITRVV